MLNILSKNQVKQSYLPSINNSLSEISKADSLIKKVAKVVKFIILMPALIVYDSLYLLSRPFKKSVKKVSLMDRIFPAGFEKNKALIAKISLAVAGAIGSYSLIKKWFSKPSDQIDLYLYGAVGTATSLFAVGGYFLLQRHKKKVAFEELKLMPEFDAILKVTEEVRSTYQNSGDLATNEKHKVYKDVKTKVDDLMSKRLAVSDNLKKQIVEEYKGRLSRWSQSLQFTITRLESKLRMSGLPYKK